MLSATFALFAGTGQCAKLLIPFTFERVGDEAVTRIDQHEAGASSCRAWILADFEREFDSRRRHLLSNQHADGFIDGRPGDRLTHSCDIVIAFRLICVPVGCSSAKALLHGSDFGRGNPIHCIFHATRSNWARPSSVIRLRTRTPIFASVF